MFPERTGLIIWLNDLKNVKQLERYGSIHYASKKMNYVAMYVNESEDVEIMQQMQKHQFVRKIEKSFRKEIPTEYNSNIPDKTRFYTS